MPDDAFLIIIMKKSLPLYGRSRICYRLFCSRKICISLRFQIQIQLLLLVKVPRVEKHYLID